MSKLSKLEKSARSLASALDQAASDERVIEVSLDDIEPDPTQPRKLIDADALKSLAASIKAQGVLQPIIIRKNESGSGSVYRIRYGERRWRAATLAGLSTIKAIVASTDQTDDELLAAQLTENMHREDMSIPDTVAGVLRLVDDVGAKKAAELLAKPQSWISKISKIGKAGGAVGRAVSDTEVKDIEALYNLARIQQQDSLVADRIVSKWAAGNVDRARADTQAMLDKMSGKDDAGGDATPQKPKAGKAAPAAEESVDSSGRVDTPAAASAEPGPSVGQDDDGEEGTPESNPKPAKTTRTVADTERPDVIARGSTADIQREGGAGDYQPTRSLADVYRVLSMNVEGDVVTLKTDRGELHFDQSLLEVVGL
mgnify:CR=1 FL=1